METIDDMNVKIQNSGKAGASNTKGSSRNLTEYLEHEDEERRKKGLTVFPFTKPDGTPVGKEEVIDKIDRNNSRLSKKDDKFYHIVISPSEKEVALMGSTDQEIYENGLEMIRHISDAYAEGFHKAEVQDGDALVIYWKPHFTRGENGELQFHLHAIASHRAAHNGPKLSPLTNHRNTQSGPVKGGFDRKAFVARCEEIFDKLMNYERSVAESFEYLNAQAHGTAEEKEAQAERLAKEEGESLRAEMRSALERGRKKKAVRREIEDLNQQLGQQIELPLPKENNLVKALDIAGTCNDIMRIFSVSQDEPALKLNMFAIGVTCRPVIAEDGGVDDFTFSLKGQRFKASETLSSGQFDDLLIHWERMTGQESTYKIQKRKVAKEAEQRTKKLAEERHYGRGFSLKIR